VVVAGDDVRATVKLSPSLPIADGTASGCLLAFRTVIGLAPTCPREGSSDVFTVSGRRRPRERNCSEVVQRQYAILTARSFLDPLDG
jgi:hypothetical protein